MAAGSLEEGVTGFILRTLILIIINFLAYGSIAYNTFILLHTLEPLQRHCLPLIIVQLSKVPVAKEFLIRDEGAVRESCIVHEILLIREEVILHSLSHASR